MTEQTHSLLLSLPIFTDPVYRYISLAGGFVSFIGVLNKYFNEYTDAKRESEEIIVLGLKAVTLGLFAVPFWYLVLTDGMLKNVGIFDLSEMSESLALLISFGLSWHTTSIFEWLSDFVKHNMNKLTQGDKK